MQDDQKDLFDKGRFDGPSYDPKFDDKRLRGQIERIFNLMKDCKWRTLEEISDATGDPAASVSAQLRHLRKPRFGGHMILKKHRGPKEQGLWEYRLLQNRTMK